jgi:hypothetical protein
MKRTPPKRPPTPGRNLGASRFCLSQELNLPGGVMSLSSARPQLRVQNARRSSFVHANCMIKDPSEPSLAPQTVELLAPILPTLHRTLPRAPVGLWRYERAVGDAVPPITLEMPILIFSVIRKGMGGFHRKQPRTPRKRVSD